MEYLEGSDFGALLKARGPLTVAEAVGYIMQVCEGLAEVHASGIVHRDLKPSNLFLAAGNDGEPVVKVLDFGISKSIVSRGLEAASCDNTSTGALVGSPQYMSPEQIRNAKRVDLRTDIWALGVILHELLANSLPFRGESLAGILAAIAADRPIPIRAVRPDVSADLEAVILRCLAKDRNQRFGSIAEFARALKPFAVGEARRSVSRIERLWSRATPMFAAESVAPNQADTMSASLPPWEDHARRRPSLFVHWPRRAALAGLLLVGGAVFWALSARDGLTLRTAAPSSPLAAPQVTETIPLGSVLPRLPSAADAGAPQSVLTLSTSVPAVVAVPSPVRHPSGRAATAHELPTKKRPALVPAPGLDDEGTADRK
jgi:serine/threonine-protein kinase